MLISFLNSQLQPMYLFLPGTQGRIGSIFQISPLFTSTSLLLNFANFTYQILLLSIPAPL